MNAKSTKVSAASAKAALPVRKRAKRLPAEMRKAIILKEASDFFAENGFAASTRDLADRIGVRQALLYKYFPSKEALIDSIFDRIIKEREDSPRAALSADLSVPLAARIIDVYDHVASLADGSGIRLISRAILNDLPVGVRLAAFLSQKVFHPVLDEIRALEGLPKVKTKPMTLGEFELIMSVHSSALFFLLRRNLHNIPLPEASEAAFRLNIDSFIAALRAAVRDIHAGKAPEALAKPFGK